jgi:hypothetical protein
MAEPKNDGYTNTGGAPYPTNGEKHEIVAAIDRFKEQFKTENETNRTQEARKTKREKATVVGIWAYTILTLIIAGASIYQARVFKETEKRQLRGYLGVTGLRFSCGDCLPTEDDTIEVIRENFGQTPLYVIGGIY